MSNLRDELTAIYDRHGRLDPELVVKTARSAKHPLHNRFEWDDAIAGEAYRRHQAHELIQSVRIVYTDGNGDQVDIRAFHAARRGDSIRPSYEPLDKVMEDPVLLALVRADMERDILSLKNRYERFEEFRTLVAKHLAA